MVDEDEKRAAKRTLPPSLNSIKSEYDVLCEELGGPADLGLNFRKRDLRRYCQEFPSTRILPILLQFNPDQMLARKHWPWVACAISLYVYELKERQRYTDEPTPRDVEQLLSEIEASAHTLSSRLSDLHKLANRLRDPSAPRRRRHLAWIELYLAQALAGVPAPEVNESPEYLLVLTSELHKFIARLSTLEGAAKTVVPRIDKDLLERQRNQTNVALPNFVFRCSAIWRSFTDRTPSANKVFRREGSENPDFVVFVGKLAEVGHATVPSRKQVETALRGLPAGRERLQSPSDRTT